MSIRSVSGLLMVCKLKWVSRRPAVVVSVVVFSQMV